MSTKNIVIRTPDLSDEQLKKLLPIIENMAKELVASLGADNDKVYAEIQNTKEKEWMDNLNTNVRMFRNVKDARLPGGMINPDYMRGKSVYNPKAKVFSKTGTVVGHCYSPAGDDCFVIRPTSGGETQWMVSSCEILNFRVKPGETIAIKRDGVHIVPLEKKK